MADGHDKLMVALLAVPESTASTLYGMYDMLGSTGRDWELFVNGVPGEPLIHPMIVSADGRRIRSPSGLAIEPEYSLADCPDVDLVAVPDLMVAPDEDIAGRHPAEVAWLRERYASGALLATACTGSMILAEAGLLDGQDATVHWAYSDAMAARYPAVRVHRNRALVISGEGRLILGGGGTAWHDLALFLIARFLGVEEAMRVARLHLVDWHHIGQQPFAAFVCRRQTGDAVIADCQEWIAQHYDQDAPVAEMVRRSGLSERSFMRRFARATGMSPLEYVHTLRLEESKQLLETTDLSVEAVANEVGYEDASFFGRLFRRKVGITPTQYRRRFATLRKALAQQQGEQAPPSS
ncbi:AraC family transcriptional regulator [Thioalkalivibrio denitrificans]|uniref:AraC family transcriptional regulator n=1 Tax=Thioalkalivibrio denitrificans TaxID=108003 RepID=A0A1V3NKQ0_9GAMM|nr:helix-turn-helix domain-containing protein [Thioalkalivibrio denitrificans]OOG25412.1 AraC family transcriptional regulator [Thioalkalivibrio denitrificans]